MKTLIVLFLVFAVLTLFTSCARDKTFQIDNTHYVKATPYGWANPEDKIDSVQYKVCVGNVVWSCILIETIAAPVILTGWYLYEPVSIKK